MLPHGQRWSGEWINERWGGGDKGMNKGRAGGLKGKIFSSRGCASRNLLPSTRSQHPISNLSMNFYRVHIIQLS